MNADLIVQPIDDIRAAVETLVAGLGGGQVFSPDLWDRSVTTLARCHDQVGGDTRRKIYDVFGVAAEPGGGVLVSERLELLARWLQDSGHSPLRSTDSIGDRFLGAVQGPS